MLSKIHFYKLLFYTHDNIIFTKMFSYAASIFYV